MVKEEINLPDSRFMGALGRGIANNYNGTTAFSKLYIVGDQMVIYRSPVQVGCYRKVRS